MKQKVVSREQWLKARKALLAKEKALTGIRDVVAEARRKLPRVRIEKPYVFDTAGGKRSLVELFGAKQQLVVYHFMFAPGWQEGCPSCSFLVDHVDGALPHLAARDVSFVAVSRAPLPQIQSFQHRMGWRFEWVSSFETDFNYDFQVSFTAQQRAKGRIRYNYGELEFSGEELHGASVFYKDSAGAVFHTYSSYGRGLDLMLGAYNWLDIVPKGRDEDGLAFTMSWLRHHDRYGEDSTAVRRTDGLR
jgi:predicted dithiol-disulfide oxidoreductase (DUF899 family)